MASRGKKIKKQETVQQSWCDLFFLSFAIHFAEKRRKEREREKHFLALSLKKSQYGKTKKNFMWTGMKSFAMHHFFFSTSWTKILLLNRCSSDFLMQLYLAQVRDEKKKVFIENLSRKEKCGGCQAVVSRENIVWDEILLKVWFLCNNSWISLFKFISFVDQHSNLQKSFLKIKGN